MEGEKNGVSPSASRSDPDVSGRIVRSAERLFRTFGVEKTTVAEIARDAEISPAYLYRFYPSKAAVHEAVCGALLERLTEVLWREARSTLDPGPKLARIFVRLTEENLRLLFEEKRLLDMVTVALDKHWDSVTRYVATIREVALYLIEEGIAAGHFRTTPCIDDRADALATSLLICVHPVLLNEARNDDPVGRARRLAALVTDGLRI